MSAKRNAILRAIEKSKALVIGNISIRFCRTIARLILPFWNTKVFDFMVVKGHKELCESEILEKIREIRNQICKFEVEKLASQADDEFNEFFQVPTIRNSAMERKVSLLLTGNKFSKCLSISVATQSKLWYPLPISWLRIMNNCGLPSNKIVSYLMYVVFNYLLFQKRVMEIFAALTNSNTFVKSAFFNDDFWFDSKLIVVQGTSDMFQTDDANCKKENLGKWLELHNSRIAKTKPITFSGSAGLNFLNIHNSHRNPAYFLNKRVPLIMAVFKLFYFNATKRRMPILHYVPFSELNLTVRIIRNINDLDKQTFFFNSSQISSKPLWAEYLESKGNRVIMVFNSVDTEPYYLSGKKPHNEFLQLTNWLEYWVADDIQRIELSDYVNNRNARIYETGLPWWIDIDTKIPIEDVKCIAFFDFEAHLGHFGLTTYNSYGYQDPKQCAELVEMVVAECAKMGIMVWHKPKREIGSRRHSQYADMLQVLLRKYPHNYRLMPSQISPSRLIRESAGCISVAFTSTAIIARDLGIPSVYFSNSNRMPGNHSRESSIPFMNSADELRTWLTKEVISLS